MLKEHLDLRVIENTLLHDLRSTQERFAHDHIYFLAESGKVVGFFARRVSSAHHSNCLLTIEEPITGSACTHTATFVGTFGLDTKVFGGSTGGDDDSVGFVQVCVFYPHFVWVTACGC